MSGAAALLVLFLLLHLLAGALSPPGWNARPFFFGLIHAAGRELDRRLNRPARGRGELAARGAIMLGVMAACALPVGAAVARLSGYPYGWALPVVFLFLCVNAMGPVKALLGVTKLLERGDRDGAAALLSSCGADVAGNADEYAVARRALEWSALGLIDFLAAPVFWFIAGGAYGAVLYMVAAGLARLYAGRLPVFAAPARLAHALAAAAPALLALPVFLFASLFVGGARAGRGLRALFAQKKAGMQEWVLAAMAGVLGITLGGPPRDTWIGPPEASAKVSIADIRRGAMIHFVFFLFVMVIVSILSMR